MSEIVKITTHEADALNRLPEQYKDKPNISAQASIAGTRAQEIENVLYEMIEKASIANGYLAILDQIGDIVKQPRNGLEDTRYRIRLLAKIAQNVSKGTGEDLIAIYRALMQAERVYYEPFYPAGAILTAVGSSPIGTFAEIKEAMEFSRAGGVSLEYLVSVEGFAFSFFDDPDPAGQGFGDYNDPGIGGFLAEII